MKRICALFLGLILLLSALSSCAARPEKHYSDKISVSSSDAEDCAVWLTDRLGESLRDRVYISVGDSAGFDMSSFENDGYILKRDGNGIVIAAKTSVGADIAVRKYANAVDLGKGTDFNITYHEGYRIKKLTLAGRDISEYTVVYPESDPELRSSANSYMPPPIFKGLSPKPAERALRSSAESPTRHRASSFAVPRSSGFTATATFSKGIRSSSKAAPRTDA